MELNIYNYLRINPVDTILVLISTALIVMIAKKFFWNYVKEYLAKREQFIQSQLTEAIEKNQESERLKQEAEVQISSLTSRAKEILDNAEVNAKKQANEIVADAKKIAQNLKQQAENEIELQKRQAMKQMKQEMSDIALLAASKVVEKELDDEVHRKYIEQFIDKAGDDSWQA